LGSVVARDEPDYDPTEARTQPSEKVQRLVDEISTLTLLEVSDLTTLLKKRLGLPARMGMMPAMGMAMGGMMPGVGMGSAAGGTATTVGVEEKKPEKTSFDLKLEKYEAASKIKIIKEVRAFTALGLKEAKELVEKAPTLLKQGVSKEEAEQIIEKLKAIGGTAIME
jgi:large subunit ribosomal protein L7/L12